MPHDNVCTLVAVQNIPAFTFSQRTILMEPRVVIIRMNLNAQIFPGVDNFHQQRELISFQITKQLSILFPQCAQRHSSVCPAFYPAVTLRVGTDCPSLSRIISGDIISKGIPESFSPPYSLLEYRF